jgi:protease I
MKKVVMIIAPEQFRDEEYFKPKEIFERAGMSVVTASAVKGACRGKLGGAAVSEMLVADIDPAQFDAVVFVGGGGAARYIDDPDALALAQNAYGQGKLVAAICVAPLILAAAGILIGKKATVFESDAPELSEAGALYTAKDVEIDGKIITGAGPFAATKFGEAVVKALQA